MLVKVERDQDDEILGFDLGLVDSNNTDFNFIFCYVIYYFNFNLVISKQTFVLVKTSWRHLEDVFRLQKTFSRRLGQDGHIHYTHTSSGDVFKTSWRRFQDVLQERLLDIFKTSSKRFQDVFKTSSRHLQNVYKTFSRGLAKTSSRHLQDAFQTFWDVFKTSCKDVFKTLSRRIIKLYCSC